MGWLLDQWEERNRWRLGQSGPSCSSLGGSTGQRRNAGRGTKLKNWMWGRAGPAWPQIDPGLAQGVDVDSFFCGIGWTRGGRDIKKAGGQICGPRCVTLLGNPGYQQLHTLLAPSTPATHCTNVHGTTRGWLVGSWWCPAQREALSAPESNHPTSTIQQKALRHDSGCCNLLSMRHYSLQYLTLRQNHTRLVITRAIKS